jgi:LacI family transcriptional regulator
VEERGLTPLVAEVDEFTIEAGDAGLAQLLELPDSPSAVFAAGEALALGVFAEARSRRMEVPGDVAIVGFTDSPTAALVDPPLTMVSVPAREIGLGAMRTLDRLIRDGEPRPSRTVLDVELVVRASCGPHQRGEAGRRVATHLASRRPGCEHVFA